MVMRKWPGGKMGSRLLIIIQGDLTRNGGCCLVYCFIRGSGGIQPCADNVCDEEGKIAPL
jgi:hypothetical protein